MRFTLVHNKFLDHWGDFSFLIFTIEVYDMIFEKKYSEKFPVFVKPVLYIGLFFIALFFFVICNASAGSSSTQSGIVTLDTMVVTSTSGNNQFQTGDVDLTQTPAFFTVIQRDAFEGRMTNLAQVIEKEAGIQVRQSGGIGSFSSVSLRGSTSEQVMIYLDGVLLNDASGGGVDLSNFSLSDVASIEIYKGSAPIQFDKPSIGGVINIKTIRDRDDLSGNVSVGYGDFNTRQASALINQKIKKWDYLISGEILDSDNDFEFKNTNGTLWNTDDDHWEDRENAWVKQINILGKAGYDISPTSRISFVNQWFNKDQGLAAWNNSHANDASLDTQRNISTLKLTLDDLSPLHLNTAFRLDGGWMKEEYKDLKGSVGLGRQHSENITYKYGLNSYTEWLTDTNSLSATANIRYEQYKPEDLTDQKMPLDSNRTLLTLGLENTKLFVNGRLSVTPAIRFIHIDNELKSDTTVAGATLDGINDNEEYWSPQIGIKFQALPWLTLKSNLNQYVREPSFFELFGDRGFFIGNMELEAEEGVNWDVGVEASWALNNIRIEQLSLNMIYFQSDVDNLITRVYDARGIGKSDNISSSRISGIEAGFNMRLFDYFTLSGSMTLQNTENNSDISAFDGNDLPGRYEASYMGRFEAHRWGGKVYLEYLADNDMFYDSANLLKAADKEEINLGASYLFKERWRFIAEVKNIQDNYYEDFYRYPMPGRSFSASMKYMF